MEKWPRDRERKAKWTKEEMKKIAEKIEKEDERLKKRELPTDNMRPETKKRIPEKQDFTLEFKRPEEKPQQMIRRKALL